MIQDVLLKVNSRSSEILLTEMFAGYTPRFAVTLNPEMVLALQRDRVLREAVERADWRLPDGIGIVWAARILGIPLRQRISGIDFAERLFTNPSAGLRRVFLLGGRNGIAENAAMKLHARFPHIEFFGSSKILVKKDGQAQNANEEREALNRIRDRKPQMLLVGFGVPKQEKWIARVIDPRNQSAGVTAPRLIMGVGGALDIWAGRLPRAPKRMRDCGLEWLWRFMLEPKRLPRMFRAVIVFPLLVLREKIAPRSAERHDGRVM